MQNEQVGVESRDEFNDSDDAFVFKSPSAVKRKLKPSSPKLKKRKVFPNNELSKSVSSQLSQSSKVKASRKPPLNKSAPQTTTARRDNNTKKEKGKSTLSPYFSLSLENASVAITKSLPTVGKDVCVHKSSLLPTITGCGEIEITTTDTCQETFEVKSPVIGHANEETLEKKSPVHKVLFEEKALNTAPVFEEVLEEKSAIHEHVKLSEEKFVIDDGIESKQDGGKFLVRKNSTAIHSFACPLCHKIFDKSSQHVSHMKQCAKKKKISTAELLRRLELAKGETCSSIELTERPTSHASKQNENAETNYELALAAAISLSMEESNRPGSSSLVADKRIIDSQKSTLERFGFTSLTNPSGQRKRKVKRIGTPVLKTRNAEERSRLVTEKAAAILLSEQDDGEIQGKEGQGGSSQVTSQFPYVGQDNKLWDLGESSEGGTWYLPQLKTYISPEKNIHEIHHSLVSEEMKDLENVPEIVFEPTRKTAEGSLSEDWGRLVGKKKWSDAVIDTLDSSVPVHSLVLGVRCPGITPADLTAPSQSITSFTLLVILKFIYTGILDRSDDCDWDDALSIAHVLGREDLITQIIEIIKSHKSPGELIPSSVTPKTGRAFAGGFETSEVHEVNCSKISPVVEDAGKKADPLETADTMPAEEFCEVVDLTQSCSSNSSGDDTDNNSPAIIDISDNEASEQVVDKVQVQRAINDDIDEFEHRKNLFNVTDEEVDLFSDYEEIQAEHKEKSPIKELSGTSSRVDMQRSSVIQFDSDRKLENKDGDDLFADPHASVTSIDNEIKIVSIPPKSPAELVLVSSDEDATPGYLNSPNHKTPPAQSTPPSTSISPAHRFSPSLQDARLTSPSNENSVPFSTIASLKTADFVPDEPCLNDLDGFWEPPENDVNDAMIDYPAPSPSPSLVTPAAPRTPRKLLTSPAKSPLLTSPLPSAPALASLENTPKSSAWSEIKSGKKRRSIIHNKVRRSGRTPVGRLRRKNVTPVVMSTRPSHCELSESVINALDEPFFDGIADVVKKPITPSVTDRPFVEVTPCISPSTRIVNTSSPPPQFSAMKTGSLKKHLRRYGLKPSLSKVKAKKILKHFYDELHPIMNTATGKLVKFLPGVENSSRSGKNKPRGVKRSKEHKNNAIPVDDVRPSTSSDLAGTVFVVPGPSSVDEDFPSSEHSSDNSDVGEGEVDSDEDELLIQVNAPSIPLDEAMKKYLSDHPDVHEKILFYEPVWLETFRKNIQSYVNVKYSKAAIMNFLDKQCIAFRSEAQAAASKKRYARKVRRKKPVSKTT